MIDGDMIGDTFWKGAPQINGMAVDTTRLAKAAAKNLAAEFKANPEFGQYIPVEPPLPDHLIRKAIYGRITPDRFQVLYENIFDAAQKQAEALFEKAETTGSNLMHVVADQTMTYLYKRPYPIQALIPTESNMGKGAMWDVIPPFGFGSAFFGREDQDFTETDVTPKNRTEYIKYLYAVGRVTKAAQLSGVSQYAPRDMLAIRIDSAQDALRALRERSMLGVTRDVSNIDVAFEAAPELGYKGLYEMITSNTADPNYVNAGQGVDTYAEIMPLIRKSYRNCLKDGLRPNLAVCDCATFDLIAAGLMEFFRTQPVREFTQGISSINLVFQNAGGLPLVPTEFLPMGDGAVGSIFLLQTDLLSRRVLWTDTYEELAKTNLSQKFVISSAEVMIDKSDVDGSHSLHGGVFGITHPA